MADIMNLPNGSRRRRQPRASPCRQPRQHGARSPGQLRADAPHQLRRLLVAPEAGHDVGALDERAHLVEQRQGRLQADLRAPLPGRRHGGAHLVGDGDAGHLVMEELGVARGVQRQHAQQHRPRQSVAPASRGALHEALPLGRGVDGLGHDEMRAGLDLAGQALDLAIEVGGGRVQGAGDGEAGGRSDGSPGLVLAPVQAPQDADEADRIDVPDARPARVVADARRVAREGQDVADAQGVGAQQLRFERHQVPVAGREVDERLEAQVALDGEADGHGAHAHPGHGAVADVHQVRAGLADELGRLQRALDVHRARRVDLHADDEAALGEGGREAGRGRRRDLDPGRLPGWPGDPCRP